MPTGEDKLAQNQDMTRSANERLQDVAGRIAEDGQVIAFLCECADEACLGRVEMSFDDYFIAHLDSNQYVVMPGHALIDGQSLVADRGQYEVLSKAAA